jgi:hypothetical protein
MRHAFLVVALCLTGVCSAAGCSSRGDSASNDSALTTDQLALGRAAVDLIAGEHAHCNLCHTASRDDVKRWGTAMQGIAHDCFSTQMSDAERVACMSDAPTEPSSSFSATKLGLFAAGASALEPLFRSADPTGARFKALKSAAMPAGTHVPGWTADEFTTVKTWVLSGMPGFDELLGGPSEPDVCVPSISPALAAHVAQMKTEGWGARLADAATPMFGCGSTSNPGTCLANVPLLSAPWGAPGVAQTLRELHAFPRTSYWVRSSADGRFVGFGQFTSAGIIDLAAPAGAPPIAVDARYDPSFFPNNDGVSFAGTDLDSDEAGPIRVCRQSALTSAASLSAPKLTLKESGCTEIANTVYQSVGAALDGAAFWMSSGAHVNDDGANQITHPLAGFDKSSQTTLIPMVSDGVGYQPRPAVELATPFEGDQMLSPSSRLLVTRFGAKAGHRGYRIRRLNTTTTPNGATTQIGATTEVIGTICGSGAKPMVSYDERFVVTHRYVDPAEGSGLPENSSNVILTDLVTGDVVRLTNMGANQYALYPHFRADGWLYFLVRDKNGSGKETLVATDAALQRLKP